MFVCLVSGGQSVGCLRDQVRAVNQIHAGKCAAVLDAKMPTDNVYHVKT